MRLKKLLSLGLAAAMAVSATVGVSAEGLYPGTAEENAMTLDLQMEPTSLNSLLATYVADGRIDACLLAPLYQYDEDSNAVPCVAESCDTSDDGLVYTFHLRDDAYWSNGTQLTANDYAFAWKMLMTADTGAEYAYFAYSTANILNGEAFYNGECEWEDVGVKVLDDLTLEVTLANPVPYFLSLMMQGCMLPVNEAYYNEVGADNYFMDPEYIISCGPYVMESWTHDSQIVLKKNPDYFDADRVSVETLYWNIYTQSDTRLNAFKAGEVDWIALTGDQATALKAEGFETVDVTEQAEYHILFNCDDEYMSNVNLRKAIDCCYSRNAFITAIRKDASVPANTFVPAAVSGYDGTSYAEALVEAIGTDGVVRNADGDAALAQEYLAKALEELGCTVDDLSAHLSMNCGDSDTAMNQAAFFQEQIRSTLGIEISINSMTTKAQSAERTNGNYVMDVTGWVGDYNDPMTWYDMWVTDGGNNSTNWSNEEYDALIEDAKSNTDLEARQQDFIRCEEILVEECPISCIYQRSSSYAVSDKITGGYVISAWQTDFRWATVQ